MTVKELYDELGKLIDCGHADTRVIANINFNSPWDLKKGEEEGYINDIPLVIDPCRQCKNEERKTEEQIEKCRLCCWYYTSSFELK